jgi:sialidase-1
VILWLATLAASTTAQDIEEIDLFRVGDHGYGLYHIPGIVVTAKGTVLAWCGKSKGSGLFVL